MYDMQDYMFEEAPEDTEGLVVQLTFNGDIQDTIVDDEVILTCI
jgi:hypothetical protein